MRLHEWIREVSSFMVQRILLATFLLIVCTLRNAKALDASEETQLSSSQFQQNASVFGDFGRGATADDHPFSVGVLASYLKTTTDSIVDETSSYALNFGWMGQKANADAKLSYANTPAEDLKVTGGQIGFGYKWTYGDEQVSKVYPSIAMRLIGQESSYVASYSGQVARKKASTRSVAGTSELRQRMLGANLKWRWSKNWRANVEYDVYAYNRDVATFQSTLDSARAVESGLAGFGTVVGGVPASTASIGLNWDFVTDWTFSATSSQSRLVVDNSISRISRVGVSWQFTDAFQASAGWIAQRSDTASDNLAFLGLDYSPE